MKPKIKYYDVPFIASLQDLLIRSAQTYKNKIAMEDLGETLIPSVSYAELLDKVLSFGAGLKKLGIKERTHIALIGENRVQWGITYFTSMLFNHIIIPIDKNLPPSEMLNILHESEAEVLIYTNQYDSFAKDTVGIIKRLKYFINMDLRNHENDAFSMCQMISENPRMPVDELPKININELAAILYTSGSLGRAKGVMLSQKNLVANLMAMTKSFFIYPEDRFLSVLPMHHTYECTCGFLCPIYAGASIHYARSLKTVVDDLQKVKATMLLGVPILYDKMFKRISKTIEQDKVKSKVVPALISVTNFLENFGVRKFKSIVFKELQQKFGGSIRCFIAGGAASDPKVAKGLREFGFNYVQGYGLTETSPIVTLNLLDNFKDNAAGIPLPGVQISINDPDNEGNGEIFVKGDNVMLGYYKNDQLTAEVIKDGWFRTGDIGFIDKDGFLHINGRKKNVIIASNGKNVYPEEVEDLLNRNKFILESMVYGEKDEKHAEIIAVQIFTDTEAFIEYAQNKNIILNEEIIEKIIDQVIVETNKELPVYKQIRKFTIRTKEFDKTTTQKIKRYLAVPGEEQN
ncbi:MAG: long-chain fatty acid--CoA ligase [Chlorobiaceae bacterium]|nr:long-chain fatty acid--CoA ligase [Chlorobiaceae bacterium]MBA4308894.1 long-chain fatty acid--CoA ligase [Chlorobiaceae bacterium]